MEDEFRNLIKLWLTAIASLCYTYFVSSNLPKGTLRFLSLLPVFSLFTFLPFTLTAALPTGVTAFFLTWLANFKLLLFSFGTGPLSTAQISLPKFITFACLPIKLPTAANRPSTAASAAVWPFPLNWPTKLALFAASIAVHDQRHLLTPTLQSALYSSMIYLLIDLILGFWINSVRLVAGIDLESPSDEPYLSTSLQDFWGRRWNLIVTNTLRHTVYRPLFRAIEAVTGAWVAGVLAAAATFLVSGLMHELMLYQISRVKPTWEVTWFFLFNGICMVAEIGVKAAVGGKWRPHRAVSGAATLGFVVVTATWWFFPPLLRNGVDVGILEDCKSLVGLFRV